MRSYKVSMEPVRDAPETMAKGAALLPTVSTRTAVATMELPRKRERDREGERANFHHERILEYSFCRRGCSCPAHRGVVRVAGSSSRTVPQHTLLLLIS